MHDILYYFQNIIACLSNISLGLRHVYKWQLLGLL